MSGRRPTCRQRGVAVITALLLTTLAVTIVASLFWQQQVQVRSIENQRMQLQKQWILRGALDWARLILSESLRSSPRNDNLQQAWAVGLAETRLDSYVENGRSDSEATDATITGKIIDAQSYLNLRGLSLGGNVQEAEVMAFERLLTTLQIEPALAQAAALGMAAGQPRTPINPAAGGAPVIAGVSLTGAATRAIGAQANADQANAAQANGDPAAGAATAASAAPRQMEIVQVEDFLAIPGFTPEIVAKLKNFVVILPKPTAINVNTAPAEVLSARIGTLPIDGARALVVSRDRAYFKDIADFGSRFAGQSMMLDAGAVDVRTNYFIVNGQVKLNRAGLDVLALIERSSAAGGTVASKVIWIREN